MTGLIFSTLHYYFQKVNICDVGLLLNQLFGNVRPDIFMAWQVQIKPGLQENYTGIFLKNSYFSVERLKEIEVFCSITSALL